MNQDKIAVVLRIAKLIKLHSEGAISAEDQAVLDEWISESEHNRQQFKKLTNPSTIHDGLLNLAHYDVEGSAKILFEQAGLKFPPPKEEVQNLRQVSRLIKYRWIVAASVLILLGAATYFWLSGAHRPNTSPMIASTMEQVLSGSSKAVLTLSDGSAVLLDSAVDKTLNTKGAANWVKVQHGQLVYQPHSNETQISYNTISTPRGGEFRLTLADGTRVWLNAESRLRYPVAFIGQQRIVSLTGEAYFEVKHDPARPFKVMVNGTEIQVLGTHFNVNAYKDEPTVSATLLEGRIKLLTPTGKSVNLRPGQQALVDSANNIKVTDGADLQKVVAWQKGLFEFDNTPLTVIMRKIGRWYDVDIVYEGAPDQQGYGGGINKNQPLSTVLKLLEANGVHFRLEGKTLIVSTPNKK